ncbi:MAG: hypothetical protein KKB47_24940 [Alphaproteobacteria bacterium]|nr:hypothetical protein [Gammaproteobacteria bacterium]MBU2134557.1 hypothetical protein [Gammaproteobacteria bacterium]MBU2366127.1 hypothetical protein [Alphaproteobacteria bacterium]
MSLHCPTCGSPQTTTRHTAMRIAALIGMLGGALRGAGTILLSPPTSAASSLNKLWQKVGQKQIHDKTTSHKKIQSPLSDWISWRFMVGTE